MEMQMKSKPLATLPRRTTLTGSSPKYGIVPGYAEAIEGAKKR